MILRFWVAQLGVLIHAEGLHQDKTLFGPLKVMPTQQNGQDPTGPGVTGAAALSQRSHGGSLAWSGVVTKDGDTGGMPEKVLVWGDAPSALQMLSCPCSHPCLQIIEDCSVSVATCLHQATETLSFQTPQFPQGSYISTACNILPTSATS